jgi:hypothetical protein
MPKKVGIKSGNTINTSKYGQAESRVKVAIHTTPWEETKKGISGLLIFGA